MAQTNRPFWQRGSGEVLNGAHRGGRSLGPENTLITAALGHAAGADFWELDVQLSADGQAMVVHDDDLARTSNAAEIFPDRAPWPVNELTAAEIRKLDFGQGFFREEHAIDEEARELLQEGPADGADGRIKAPTLEEALTFAARLKWPINIEIKEQKSAALLEALTLKVIRAIKQYNLSDQVLISSFDLRCLSMLKDLNPDIATGVLIEDAVEDPLSLVRSLGARTYHPHRSLLPAEHLADFKRHRIPVIVWTVNEPGEMLQFIDSGVSGIITDRPQALATIKRERTRQATSTLT